MTKVYKQLAHKDQVSSITIDNDGTTHILGKTGKEMSFDRSAGETRAAQALTQVAGTLADGTVRTAVVSAVDPVDRSFNYDLRVGLRRWDQRLRRLGLSRICGRRRVHGDLDRD